MKFWSFLTPPKKETKVKAEAQISIWALVNSGMLNQNIIKLFNYHIGKGVKNAEKKIANTGAIISNAIKLANIDDLFQFNKTRIVIDYQPTLSIIF